MKRYLVNLLSNEEDTETLEKFVTHNPEIGFDKQKDGRVAEYIGVWFERMAWARHWLGQGKRRKYDPVWHGYIPYLHRGNCTPLSFVLTYFLPKQDNYKKINRFVRLHQDEVNDTPTIDDD